MDKEQLRKEFYALWLVQNTVTKDLTHKEIADWWLAKIEAAEKQAREEMEWKVREEVLRELTEVIENNNRDFSLPTTEEAIADKLKAITTKA